MSKEIKSYKFSPETDEKGIRLDIFLLEKTGLTRAKVQKLIDAGKVLVNGNRPKKAGDKLGRELEITVDFSETVTEAAAAVEKKLSEEKMPEIEILADAPDYIVVNKPAGVLVHPTDLGEGGTLVAWLLAKYPEVKKVGEEASRPGIVHRLDKEASGVLVMAKTQKMYKHLKKQFQTRKIEKEYTVLVHGIVDKDHDTIDFDIDRGSDGVMVSRPKIDKTSLKQIRNIQPGKESLTEFLVKKRFGRFTLLSVFIHTGRTHQIRVHMRGYNTPVVGDEIYINKKLNLKRDKTLGRLFLHATRLGFSDLKGERVCFEAGLPKELEAFLGTLK